MKGGKDLCLRPSIGERCEEVRRLSPALDSLLSQAFGVTVRPGARFLALVNPAALCDCLQVLKAWESCVCSGACALLL